MQLMIVESPNKVKKIQGILGQGWTVAASVGHIRDLPAKEMGVSAPDFLPQYVYSDRGADVVDRLKSLVAKASTVYLATDPDREGEAIAWHLQQTLKLKNYRRVTFNAINADVIEEALRKPRAIDTNLVRAQEGRRVLDRLVGYMVSPQLSMAYGIQSLSAGRVQSPATRLVVERERQIQIFKPTKHFGASVSFGDWQAEWNTKPHLDEDKKYVLDRALAESAASCREFTVSESATKPMMKAPPAPFRSATLMQAASVQLQFTPEKTMQLAQKLFEGGHINYHRTDAQNYDDSTIAEIRAFAESQGWPLPAKPRKWSSVEGAQEGHEAIKPMHLSETAAGDTDDEKRLYRMIWLRAMASQLADAQYQVSTNVLTSTANGQTFEFIAKGRILTVKGWKALTASDATEESDAEGKDYEGGAVPSLEPDSAIKAVDGQVLEKTTQAPSRYTLASLVAKLESMGIGRPSTYPTILKNIMERGYIVEEKRKLKATELGFKTVIALLKNGFEFINYQFTANLELELDRVARGEASYIDVVSKTHAQLEHELQSLQVEPAEAHPCPLCGSPLRRIGARGKGTYFWGCSAYKDTGCKGAMDDKDGRPVPANRQAKPTGKGKK